MHAFFKCIHTAYMCLVFYYFFILTPENIMEGKFKGQNQIFFLNFSSVYDLSSTWGYVL